ncbi:DUF6717 family protein [Algoriphagus sp.]|uniref:DUF6717 family protein n=1 Tax=Algoriphagus sp. TaxID=1872435 RepID=UPI00391A7D82
MKRHTHRFYKEEGRWYIDLPEFLEKGLGTKDNLQMVGGSDKYLDLLYDVVDILCGVYGGDSNYVTLTFSDQPLGYGEELIDTFHRTKIDKDDGYLESVGHPAVDSGAYYKAEDGFEIWLCPVTKYVFQGDYPETIYVALIETY